MSQVATKPRRDAPASGFAVDFSQAGDSRPLLREGWSGQERDFVWTIGPRSRIVLPAAASSDAAALVLDIAPCLAAGLVSAQWLAVLVNGTGIGCQRIDSAAHVRCRIPAGVIKAGRPIELVFEHAGFLRLDRLSMGAEDRPLALRFYGLRLQSDAETMPGDALAPRSGAAVIELLPHPPAPPAATKPIIYSFGAGEAGHDCLRSGWYTDEAGLVWSAAPVSRLHLPPPEFDGPVSLSIGLAPLIVGNFMPVQRVAVVVAGLMLGQFQVRHETAIAVTLPAGASQAGELLEVAFCTPDALPMRQFQWADPEQALGLELAWIRVERAPLRARAAVALRGDGVAEPPPVVVSQKFLDLPADELRAAIEADLGIKPADLMRNFESLGDNCAFGLAQRKAGAEVLGLLRFANTPLRSLLRGLADGFRAALQKADIELYLHPDGNPREYMLRIARYGIRWHTMVHEPDAEADAVARDQIVKLGFLRRKFEEGLRASRKIYTIVRSEPLKFEVPVPGYNSPASGSARRGTTHVVPAWDPPQSYEVAPAPLFLAEAQAVMLELNRSGPNTLLYFELASPSRPAGTVELLAPGLMRATMSSFVILPTGEAANDLDWVRVAANAWLLNRDANAAFRATETD
jgi:hypothetical protein